MDNIILRYYLFLNKFLKVVIYFYFLSLRVAAALLGGTGGLSLNNKIIKTRGTVIIIA